MFTEEKAVVCLVNDPIPIAYLNVYEKGDIWIKIKGCDNCSYKNMKKCCGNCPMLTEKGCFYHLEEGKFSSKPYNCVISPLPNTVHSYCQLEFKCISGSKKEQIRKINKPGFLVTSR